MDDGECLKIIHRVLDMSYQVGYETAMSDIGNRLEEKGIDNKLIHEIMQGLNSKIV